VFCLLALDIRAAICPASQAPEGTARMRNYTIRFDSDERRLNAVNRLDLVEAVEGGHLAVGPSWNGAFIQESV
jgi:hypothetical protein